MQLTNFIEENLEPILVEWGAFAQTRIPAAATMTKAALRDHAQGMLLEIVVDMRQVQSERQRSQKSKGLADPALTLRRAASTHGADRHLAGFTLVQVTSEFRALRATVLRLWNEAAGLRDAFAFEQLTRFNEGIDQALAESVLSYSARIDESRDMFLAVLGHDLRGPLASLSNCIEVQARAPESAELRSRTALLARQSVAAMNTLITDLLAYTKTRLGRGIEVLPQTGDIGELCEECVDQARAAYPATPFEFGRTGDLRALFDSARFRQVLTNLLTNAVQHGDRSCPVHFSVDGDDSEIRICVHNRGAPIPPNALQVIFNPLVHVAHSASAPDERPHTSLGLGLFIAREIMIAHGGEISVSSTEEAGTTFALRLPRAGV